MGRPRSEVVGLADYDINTIPDEVVETVILFNP